MRVLRMDADTTRSKNSYEEILSAFRSGEADVLVGTQMIVKGHDFPNVTLVGVLAADMSLSVGDYRAGERTFQLITQAAGRAGRGTLPGEVVVQTYQPEHYAIVHAARQDYLSFYEEEIMYRRLMKYPPAAHMLAVQVFGKNEAETLLTAQHLADRVKGMSPEDEPENRRLQLIGPAAAGIGKIEDVYRFVFYIKHMQYDRLIMAKDHVENCMQEINLNRVTIQFDFDPMNVL